MNFTDVDDKTIAARRRPGMELREYTDQYIRRSARTRARSASSRSRRTPRATDEANLEAMADMIAALEQQRPHLPQRRLDLLQDLDDARATASWRGSITRA